MKNNNNILKASAKEEFEASGNILINKSINDLYNFFEKQDFQWMITLTFRNAPSEKELWLKLNKLMKLVNYEIYGSNATKKGVRVAYFAVAEKCSNDRLHIHMLIKDNGYYFKITNQHFKVLQNHINFLPYIFYYHWQKTLQVSYEVTLKSILDNSESFKCVVKRIDEESSYNVIRYTVKDFYHKDRYLDTGKNNYTLTFRTNIEDIFQTKLQIKRL